MDWQALLVLATILFFLLYTLVRIEKRSKRVILIFVALPILVLIIRWTNYRQNWDLTLIAGGLALVGIIIWWFAVGRKLPSSEPSIRVWNK
jgi:hypothetical protein